MISKKHLLTGFISLWVIVILFSVSGIAWQSIEMDMNRRKRAEEVSKKLKQMEAEDAEAKMADEIEMKKRAFEYTQNMAQLEGIERRNAPNINSQSARTVKELEQSLRFRKKQYCWKGGIDYTYCLDY
jgi:Flp pilus assembly protein TadB